MRVALLPIAAAMLWTTPVAAQIWGGPGASGMSERIAERPPITSYREPHVPGVGRDLNQIDRMIRDGRENGQLSRREARDLRRQAAYIDGLETRYRNGGLTSSEQAELRSRTEGLRGRVTAARGP